MRKQSRLHENIVDHNQRWFKQDFTLKEVECLGSCGTAPMLQCGVDYFENLTNEKVDTMLEKMKSENRLRSYVDTI